MDHGDKPPVKHYVAKHAAPAVRARAGSEDQHQASRRPKTQRRAGGNRRINSPVIKVLIACVITGVIALGAFLIFVLPGAGAQEENDSNNETGSLPVAEEEETLESTVSFVAVGDNLPEIEIAVYADASSGTVGDGVYDYTPIYSAIKPYIENVDLAFIDFEVHAGGDDIGPRGWPSFNTTSSMVDAVYDTGFDLIASATNHSYDWAEDALVHSANLWKQKDVLFTGTAVSPEDAATIKTYEKGGIVFSLLNYTYGVNGYDEAEIPSYAVNYMHEDRIRADIAAAREISDVVIVAMHWGTEYQTEPDETQRYYAQLIADAGADLILGSHPHVIGPLAWLEGAGGNKTLVAYSLGNFLSNHEQSIPLVELEGMLQCDFVRDAVGAITIENVSWTPLINHPEPGNYRMYAVKDYSNELAMRQPTLAAAGLDDPLAWLKETSAQIIGPDFLIDQ